MIPPQLYPNSRGAEHTFAWLEEELYAVNAVVSFASKRLEGAADVLEQEFYRFVHLLSGERD